MISKFLGKEYEGFTVVKAFLKSNYKNKYGKDKKPTQHKAYSFILENKVKNITITISGNQLRLIDQGKRTIEQMLSSPRGGGYKNKFIREFKKEVKYKYEN